MQRFFLLLILATSAWPAQPESQRLIKLNVAVTDAKGEPVTDLTAADLQLKEDGKPREMAFFRFTGSKRPMAPLAAGEIGPHAAPPTTVILLDRWNEQLITTAVAWAELTKAIQGLETSDGVYVYILTNRGDLLPVRALPTTPAEAAAAAQVTSAQLSTLLDDAVKKTSGFRGIDEQNPILRYNTTAKAISGLGQQMSAVAGRKSLIWVTHGVPLTVRLAGNDYRDFTPQLRLLGAAAVLSQIAIYTVDQSAAGAGAAPDLSRQSLQLLSSLTGGRWFPSDAADTAIHEAMADARAGYTAAFYTTVGEKDRKLHKVHFETSRKGLRILTREGHYGDTPQPAENAIQDAVFDAARRSPFDAAEIELRVSSTTDPADKSTHFRIRVDPADVLLTSANQHHQGHLSLMLASYADGVLTGASSPIMVDLNLTDEQYQKALKEGLIVEQGMNARPKTTQVRAIVFDRELHSVGSATVPISQP